MLTQIKGKTIGEGRIHGSSAAGAVMNDDLKSPNPLISRLKKECSEELGINLDKLNASDFYLVVDESELGILNCAAVAKNADLEDIVKKYEEITINKIKKYENLEVAGLALIPMDNPTITQIQGGEVQLEDITCFIPTKNGLTTSVQNRKIRPYTAALMYYLYDEKNRKNLLKKARI